MAWSGFVSSSLTRYAVLASQPAKHLPREFRASRDYIGEPSFNAFNGLQA
jgi:predicted Zn-dependent protease with MMP-like domain